jgi:hypothetical protein
MRRVAIHHAKKTKGLNPVPTYRVYLKDNREIDVIADHFTFDGMSGWVSFYKSKDEVDEDIAIAPNQIIAILPKAKDKVPNMQPLRM